MATVNFADPKVTRRRVIEALRSGVPSREAVAVLGSSQPDIEDRFLELLEARKAPSGAANKARGMLIGGDFGAGKSHVLEHLAHLALEGNFAVSKVVISKETPLHDPAKVFRAAIESIAVPGYQGADLAEVASRLDSDDPAYSELFRWVHSPASGLNERFAATLFLFDRLRNTDEEFSELIVRFWEGDPLRLSDVRRRLRELGEAATYPFPSVSVRDLALQRFSFVSRLIKAAGFGGWVILFDEVELIGRYSVLQRAKSYAELAGWVRGNREDPAVPLAAVLAITTDFESAVISTKNDRELVPAKLRARQSAEFDAMAGQSEVGMGIIEREMVRLSLPDQRELDRAYQSLRQIHADAFDWDPPDVAGLERLSNTRMRQYVRAWINEWDLVRADPEFTPSTMVTELLTDYREDVDLDVVTDRDDEPDSDRTG